MHDASAPERGAQPVERRHDRRRVHRRRAAVAEVRHRREPAEHRDRAARGAGRRAGSSSRFVSRTIDSSAARRASARCSGAASTDTGGGDAVEPVGEPQQRRDDARRRRVELGPRDLAGRERGAQRRPPAAGRTASRRRARRAPTRTGSRSPKMKSVMTKPVEAPLVAQHVGEQRVRLAGPLAVQRVVRAHDARDALVDHAPEVRQVHLVQRALVGRDVDGEPRVLHRVAREVLHAREHVLLHAAGERGAHLAEQVRILAVGLLRPTPRRMAEQVHADATEVRGARRRRASSPMTRPISSSSATSNVAARAIATGKHVALPTTTPRGPSVNANPGMPRRVVARPPATRGGSSRRSSCR